ncbi:uncharacterized protein Z519_11191 [Cladophialophora bantiana CBS 173.52]|uniref:Uncharacterized protein n=1 Tax=Cladophialophora bantiana (strain ATCC 10958 / CBS 173.52 / CDC B-1940 / NIH 8579) TaxID=1442370 RepID=A0A0D2EDA1_CLAB1|nr:uncharacterized protein Z519_11191 [Cladophialophora bantiana CBS 173.52]KIW88081.1 hypothetical protein Z519_11191 [Cladophialophora bantiana CBS 173.52]
MAPSFDPSLPSRLNLLDARNDIPSSLCYLADYHDVVQSFGHIQDEEGRIIERQKRACHPDLISVGKQFESCCPHPDVQAHSDDQDVNLENVLSAMGLDGTTPPEPGNIIQDFNLPQARADGGVTQPAGAAHRPLDQAAGIMRLGQLSTLQWGDVSEQASRIAYWLAGSTTLDPFHLINLRPNDDIWQWQRELRSGLTRKDFESTDTDAGGSEEAEIWSIDDEPNEGTDLTSEMSL